jgi:hypothetical protein
MIVVGAWAAEVPVEMVEKRLAEVESVRAKRQHRGAPVLPAEAYRLAATGEVATGLVDVEGQKARTMWGVGVVDVPIGAYFSAINDDANKAEYSKLTHVLLLEGGLCGSPRKVFQYMDVPMITDRWWVIEQRINTDVHQASGGRVREMSWTHVKDPPKLKAEAAALAAGGMEIAATEGGWFLVDLDGTHTLVEFWTFSDPGGNVPVRLAQTFASGSVSETMASMAVLARKGSNCSL